MVVIRKMSEALLVHRVRDKKSGMPDVVCESSQSGGEYFDLQAKIPDEEIAYNLSKVLKSKKATNRRLVKLLELQQKTKRQTTVENDEQIVSRI